MAPAITHVAKSSRSSQSALVPSSISVSAPDQRDSQSSEHDECSQALHHSPKSQDPRLPVTHQIVEALDPGELGPLRLDERVALLPPSCLRILLFSRLGAAASQLEAGVEPPAETTPGRRSPTDGSRRQ